MTTETMTTVEHSDAELVAESLGGSRDAFRRIVERYQTLVCSLAYSATGNVSQSEDVAQETFISAWTQLRSLREPDKLRGWLCGIARHRIHRSLREEQREPVRNAAPLEHAQESPGLDAMPSEQAISREEEAILWRSLEKIPALYREPLILFYREHQSIERVAEALELSEDAVKQRLSRGRKLLQEEVQTFVERSLRRTAPGQAFSGAVWALLPFATAPAATASLGATAKGAAAAKSGFLTAWLALLMPFLGIAAGIVAQWLIIRHGTTDRRSRIKQLWRLIAGWILYLGLAVLGESALHTLAHHFRWDGRTRFTVLIGFWWFFTTATLTVLILVFQRLKARRQLQEAAGEVCKPATPMKSGTLAGVIAGGYLALFSWLISFAWRAGDLLGVAIITATMLVLGTWAFLQTRSRLGEGAAPTHGRHLAMAGGMILLILNLRCDVWVALSYGVSPADAHRLQPLWIIPLLTLGLLIWSAVLLLLTNRRPAT